jgi:hypothetical protein
MCTAPARGWLEPWERRLTVSGTDNEIRAAFRRLADGLDLQLERSLREVEARERHERRRRRTAAAVAAAAAVALVTGLVWRLTGGTESSPAPAPPPGIGNPIKVVRTIPAGSLGLSRVLKVAVGPNDRLYVTDRADTVSEVTEDGRVLRTWGGPGSASGQLRLLSGSVAVGPDGHVYVSDAGNYRVQVFSPDGRPVGQLGRYGRGPGLFLGMDDVAVDAQGEVYVEDGQQRRLTKFSPTGAVDWQLGRGIGSDPDLHGFLHLGGFDPAGDLLAANDDAGKLVWISPDGSKVGTVGTGESGNRGGGVATGAGDFPHGTCEVSQGPGGLVFVLSCEDRSQVKHQVSVLGADHRLTGRWLDAPVAMAPAFFADGTGVIVSRHGDLMEVTLDGGR